MTKRALTLRAAVAVLTFVTGVAAVLLVSYRRMPLRSAEGDFAHQEVPRLSVSVTAQPYAEPEAWNPPVSHPLLPDGHLLEVGEFHGESVKARTGQHWLGLYVTGSGSFLADSVLKITAVHDDITDEPHQKTGKRVSVDRRPDPILLVEGARTLRPGPVSTVFAGDLPMGNGSMVDLKLGALNYNLYVKTKNLDYDRYGGGSYIGSSDAKLVLSEGEEREQVLYDLGGSGGPAEAYWKLFWAGDADGDGKLDLYVEVSHHYNVWQSKLFLSSLARKGKLVREVAEFVTWGC